MKSLKILESIHTKLKIFCAVNNMNIFDVVNDAVTQYLERNK